MNDPDAIRARAADWVVALNEAANEQKAELQRRCLAWQQEDEQHQRVFRQMLTLWDGLEQEPPKRRRTGALVVWLLIGLIAWQLPWTLWRGDAHTGAGERQVLTLDDGSHLTLNGDSAVRLDMDADLRRVRLLRGQVFVNVAPDRDRPFQVITRHGIAEALGTEYSVSLDKGATRVAVKESSVRVTPAGNPSTARVLHAGEGTTLTRGRATAPTPLAPGRFDWLRGRLVFNDAPLTQVLDTLADHRPGLLLAAPSLATDLRFTGVLPADDSDGALAVLADAMPVRVHRVTPYLVWVGRR